MIAAIFKGCGLLVIAAVALLVAVVANFHRETENRILAALDTHYAPATLDVVKRKDWGNGRDDFNFGGQICFEVDVREPSGKEHRKVAMMVDHDDGGAFEFAREYRSFKDCTDGFDRG